MGEFKYILYFLNLIIYKKSYKLINYFYYLYNYYYEYNNKKAIIKENKPVASARAKPKIAKLNNCPLICGFLAVEAISAEKIKPIPAPAPIKPEQANPAPKYLAAANILNY